MMRSRFRILHVIDRSYPILGYQETFLARVEAEQGHDAYLLTSNLIDRTVYKLNKDILGQQKMNVGQFLERGVKTIRLPALCLPVIDTLCLFGLEEVVTKLNPDVIICHGIAFLSAIRLARLKKRLPKVKLIFDDHMTSRNTRGGVYNWIYGLFKLLAMPLILGSSHHFVAVTLETKRFMEHVYGIPVNKIKIIPLGADTKLFHRDLVARKQVRSKFNINDSDVVFIYAGRIVPEKEVHLLVEASLKVINDFPGVKIMLVGGTTKEYEETLRRRVSSSRFKSNFNFVAAVPNEELYKFYSAADVGVWPPRSASVSINEAMACGLPIILSDDSSVNEVICGGNGMLYHSESVLDLVDKMEKMVVGKRREVMSSEARKFAENNDWHHISDRFLELIEQ